MMKALRHSKFLLIAAGIFMSGAIKPAYAKYELPYVGEQKTYIATADDTLVHIARRYSLGFVEMRAANPNVDPWIPGEGVKLTLPSRHLLPDVDHSGVVINLPEMRLYAFVNGDAPPSTYALGIGREGLETPTGTTKVLSKKEGPTWRPTARMLREDPTLKPVVPPGPDNPLGTHALYLGWSQYRIHGTNKPYGIGRRSSSGCLRLYPEDIINLYDMIPVGASVTVVNQPIKLAWINDVLYMEAHPDMAQALQMEETGQVYAAKMSDQDMAFIVSAAGDQKDRLHWATIRNEIRNRSGVPVMIARKEGAEFVEPEFEVIDGRKIELSAQQQAAESVEVEPPAFVSANDGQDQTVLEDSISSDDQEPIVENALSEDELGSLDGEAEVLDTEVREADNSVQPDTESEINP